VAFKKGVTLIKENLAKDAGGVVPSVVFNANETIQHLFFD